MGEYVFQVATDEELVVEDGFDATVLLASPSPESWKRIVQIGKAALPHPCTDWPTFETIVSPAALKHWPPVETDKAAVETRAAPPDCDDLATDQMEV